MQVEEKTTAPKLFFGTFLILDLSMIIFWLLKLLFGMRLIAKNPPFSFAP